MMPLIALALAWLACCACVMVRLVSRQLSRHDDRRHKLLNEADSKPAPLVGPSREDDDETSIKTEATMRNQGKEAKLKDKKQTATATHERDTLFEQMMKEEREAGGRKSAPPRKYEHGHGHGPGAATDR